MVRPPVAADSDLFRAEMAADGVKPLAASAASARVKLEKPRPRPAPLQRMADEASVSTELLTDTSGWDGDIETGDLITFLRPGLPRDVLRKLKRGQWVVQATLDLHGCTTAVARDELARFLRQSRQQGLRCVLIIHGRGTRSPNNVPLIRNKVRLSLSLRDEVLAFSDALPADGGSGAVMVLLKSG